MLDVHGHPSSRYNMSGEGRTFSGSGEGDDAVIGTHNDHSFSLFEKKNTVQAKAPTRCPCESCDKLRACSVLQNSLETCPKKGYTNPAVRMYVRCVGAATTCAGVGELALSYTAVLFFFMNI